MGNSVCARLLGILLAFTLAVGCGSNQLQDYVPVSGKVTYEDGSLIDAQYITVTFLPLATTADPERPLRPSMAEVNVADGTFAGATTRTPDDGIMTGKHRVVIKACDELMNLVPGFPRKYADEADSPLEADSSNSPFHFLVERE